MDYICALVLDSSDIPAHYTYGNTWTRPRSGVALLARCIALVAFYAVSRMNESRTDQQ